MPGTGNNVVALGAGEIEQRSDLEMIASRYGITVEELEEIIFGWAAPILERAAETAEKGDNVAKLVPK